MPTAQKSVRDEKLRLAENLYVEHRQRLLAIARRNSDRNEEAEDALQDAFILFIDRFEPTSGAPPLAWLTLTLKRRCWALGQPARRVTPAQSEQLEDPGRSPEERAEASETLAERHRQIADLKPAERRALGLLSLGFSYREIGQLTGWTHTKVNRCLSEGRAALRGSAAGAASSR